MRSLASAVFVALSLALVSGVAANAGAQGEVADWSIGSSPNEEGSDWLQAVDASASDNAWAVGFYVGAEGVYETLAERWDGSGWMLAETPNVGANGDWLNEVAAVSPS